MQDRRRQTEKPDSPLVAGDLAQLGRNLLMRSRSREAEPLLRESLVICEKALADDWKRYDAMSLLGGSWLDQARYAEAEPLIVKGYEGMKDRESRITAPDQFHLREAAVRVVRLYEAWGFTVSGSDVQMRRQDADDQRATDGDAIDGAPSAATEG